MNMIPLNLAIMKNPWNWINFTLMFLIACYAISILLPDSSDTAA